MKSTVYLSGEIRIGGAQISNAAEASRLPINFASAVIDHEASDATGDLPGTVSGASCLDI
jgi:hypothetical protein